MADMRLHGHVGAIAGSLRKAFASASRSDPENRVGLGPPIGIGLGIIALFFGSFGVWATLAPLESAALAPGVVIVDTKRKTVQHLEGGIIGEILVKEGETVKAGQVLIRLDKTQPGAALELQRGRYRAAAALEARLIAERDGRDEIRFPDWLLAERGDPKVDEIIAGQTGIFEARRGSLASRVSILKQRSAQIDEEIKGLKGQIEAENIQLRLIADEIEDISGLVKKGLARMPRLRALQREQANIRGSRSQNRASIARARQSIGETRLQITELRTAFIKEVVENLREVQSEKSDLIERLHAAEDVLQRIEVTSPLDGTVVDMQVHTLGGVVAPGEPLMDIVPSEDRLVVEARVDPKDIDVVHPGLSAQVRLTAFNQRNFAPLEGRVTSVSADRLTDERSGEIYYLVRIELAEGLAEALDGAELYPGMPAEVMIVTGERTALDYLVRPISRSLGRAFRED